MIFVTINVHHAVLEHTVDQKAPIILHKPFAGDNRCVRVNASHTAGGTAYLNRLSSKSKVLEAGDGHAELFCYMNAALA